MNTYKKNVKYRECWYETSQFFFTCTNTKPRPCASPWHTANGQRYSRTFPSTLATTPCLSSGALAPPVFPSRISRSWLHMALWSVFQSPTCFRNKKSENTKGKTCFSEVDRTRKAGQVSDRPKGTTVVVAHMLDQNIHTTYAEQVIQKYFPHMEWVSTAPSIVHRSICRTHDIEL